MSAAVTTTTAASITIKIIIKTSTITTAATFSL